MEWLIGVGFVVVLINVWHVHYEVRLLRTQVNRITGPPTDRDASEAASLSGDVDYMHKP